MKKFLLAATALASLSMPSFAADPYVADPQWYITGFAGYAFAEDYESAFVNNITGAQVDYNVSMDDGFVIGGALGYIWNPNIRTELELSYGSNEFGNDYRSAGFVGLGESGSIDSFMVFANTWFNHSLGWVDPYIGGGVGVAFSHGDLSLTNGAGNQFSSNETDLAAQFGAGLRFPVSSNVEIDASYRLRAVFDLEFDSDIAGFSNKGSDFITHTAQLGLTYKF